MEYVYLNGALKPSTNEDDGILPADYHKNSAEIASWLITLAGYRISESIVDLLGRWGACRSNICCRGLYIAYRAYWTWWYNRIAFSAGLESWTSLSLTRVQVSGPAMSRYLARRTKGDEQWHMNLNRSLESSHHKSTLSDCPLLKPWRCRTTCVIPTHIGDSLLTS